MATQGAGPGAEAAAAAQANGHSANTVWDCAVVGGGPAGLSAALILARARRSVLIFDSGDKRNEKSLVLAYPTAQLECLKVEDIDIEAARIEDCRRHPGHAGCDSVLQSGVTIAETAKFVVCTEDGRRWRSKKLILATGVQDHLPQVDGFADFWARGIWVCLYCDGYEYRDQAVACYGNRARGVHLALEMHQCVSPDVVLLTDGETLEATQLEREALRRLGVRVFEQRLARAYGGDDGHLAGVELADDTRVPLKRGAGAERGALFFNTGRCQNSPLPRRMGLKSDARGDLVCDARGNVASVHGLYVAGNMAQAPLKLVNSELFNEAVGLYEDSGPRFAEPFGARATAQAQDANGSGMPDVEGAAATGRAAASAGKQTISTRGQG
eukprot:scaffold2.g7472.t1